MWQYHLYLVISQNHPEDIMPTPNNNPLPVKIIAVLLFLFGLAALFGSLFMWGEGFILTTPGDLSFAIPDIFVNAPASIIAALGLWQMKRYGYVAAQFVAGFYLYASLKIFVMAAQGELPATIEIILPQILAVLVALALVFYLWPIQDRFGSPEIKTKRARKR
jgi:hypothetical protein